MDIVMIPFHDCKKWMKEGFRTRDAHLAEHFCMDQRIGKILVINRPVSLAEVCFKRTGWKINAEKMEIVLKGKNFQITKLNHKLYCLDTFLPDFFKVAKQKKLWWSSAFENKFVLDTIQKAVKYLKLEDSILLLQNPMAVNVIKAMNYKCFAFDAIDNWLYHSQMSSNHSVIKDNYQYIEENADVIFTVSHALTKLFKENKNVYWVANGVDIDFFTSGFSNHVPGTPITVGYIGKIQERVDFELVEACLKKFSNIQFVFMGPVYSQKKIIKRLQKNYSNLLFTGDIHYKNLPQAMKKIDLAIIPHRVDDFTESMNPLKLYEYLAAGKPVVSTRVAGISDISPYVYSAGSYDEFIAELSNTAAMAEQGKLNPQTIAESIPAECSWTYRCDEIINILENNL